MNIQPQTTEEILNNDELQKAIDGCANEAVHITGSIQPHGYMLILDNNFKIHKASQNVEKLLGQSIDNLIGSSVNNYISSDKITELQGLITEGPQNPIRFTTLSLPHKTGTAAFDAVIHRSSDYLILELEPRTSKNGDHHEENDLYQEVMNFSVYMQNVTSHKNLYQYIVREVRRITGFDRVKLYKFAEDDSGEVIAESKEPFMESYLGLHFPATDIPQQARKLFVKNYIRVIADTRYKALPILPNNLHENGEAIDLTFSCLRSVSPVHTEYLRNMGVQASMSISLIQNNRLWGMLACHHSKPLLVPYPKRMTAELIAHSFSAFLSKAMQSENEQRALEKKAYVQELKTALTPDQSLLGILKDKHELILNAIDADGVIVRINEKFFAFGLLPEIQFVEKLIKWLEENYDRRVFISNSIIDDTHLDTTNQSMAGGVIAVPVSVSMNDYIIWFRQEKSEGITWAGKPEKKIMRSEERGLYLAPRNSFSQWKDDAHGQARPWSKSDIDSAEYITKLLLNKKYEEGLKQADYDLQSILNNSNAFIYITDIEGRIIKINESFLGALDLKYDDIAGKHDTEVFKGKFADIITQSRIQVLAAKKSMNFERDFIFNGKQYHLVTVKFPLYDTNHDIYALCSISTDVSKLKQVQRELEASNKELEKVAFVAAHDLQEPIRMIANFTQLLDTEYQDKKLDKTAKEYIDFTLSSTERMRVLIQDLLQYSRLGQEKQESLELINTQNELASVLKQFYLSDNHKDAIITVSENIPNIAMKPEHFASLIQNLVGNALKYKDETRTPQIKIACDDNEDIWKFSISDNGIGIKKEYLEKIFLIFQRLHKRSEYEGTGVGLALCSRIIEMYDGKIWAESELGKGSTFFFIVPKLFNITE